MNFVLVEIKKFLKKLETGQLEIEVGQWELHKDITRLKNSIQELKQMKKDILLMKEHGMKLTNLIKEIQLKLNTPETIKSGDKSSTISCCSLDFGSNTRNNEKVGKKKKNQCKLVFSSGKLIKFKSKNSIKKRQSVKGINPKNEKGTSKGTKPKCQEDLFKTFKKLKSQNRTKKPPKIPFSNQNILQRYLQDSAIYRKTPGMSCTSSERSSQNEASEPTNQDFQNNSDLLKGKLNLTEQSKGESNASIFPEKLTAVEYPENSSFRDKCLRHNRRYEKAKSFCTRNMYKKCFCKNNWKKKHGKVHEKCSSKNFRGFRCSYCDKICHSPEKLTAHLKSCRIITKRKPVKNN